MDEIAVQLFSIRQAIDDALEESLARLAGLGYRGVELAGLAGARPERWSDLLLRYHLVPVGMHVPYEALDDDAEGVAAEASIIAAPVIVLPALPESKRDSAAAWDNAADWMNRVGERVRKAGKRFAYHNHWFEFDAIGPGETGYDRLLAKTDPALVEFELDLFWAARAGQSLPDLIARLGQRMTLCHIKDMTGDNERTFAPVGHGTLPWAQLFPLLNVESLIVEQDRCSDPDPFTCLQASIEFLQSKSQAL